MHATRRNKRHGYHAWVFIVGSWPIGSLLIRSSISMLIRLDSWVVHWRFRRLPRLAARSSESLR